VGLIALVSQSSFFYPGQEELARTTKRQISMIKQVTAILETADDEEGARAAAQRAVPVLKKLTASVKGSAARKANKEDIEAVKKKYVGKVTAAVFGLVQAVVKLRSIPGADEPVSETLKPPLDELIAASPDGKATPGLNLAFTLPTKPPPKTPAGRGSAANPRGPARAGGTGLRE
jgi:hypothetical protein